MTAVSVVVPVFNTEKYLPRCLDSLSKQTLSDIEIICINDGSTDGSLKILEEYATKDARIKVLSQENSKQGAARNRGLEIAKGEFVTFVDSDDWIEPDYCELLYNAAQKHNVNIAAATTVRNYDGKTKYHLKLTEEKVYTDVNSIIQALEYNFNTSSKLYRFDKIKNLRFEENVLYEDGPYTLKAFDIEKTMVTVPDAIYHYYSNPKSTVKQKISIKNENDKISTSLQVIEYAKKHNIDIGDFVIIKENHLLWKIKHYIDHKDFYLCGIKVCSKKEVFDNSKVFLVFNTACFGDVLLCNSLCQNIKNIFPESKVVFVCDKKWEPVARNQEGVDDVIVYDKKGINKGLFGLLKFVKNFPYKNVYASLITYKNERNFVISKLLKSRFIISEKHNSDEVYKPLKHAKLLEGLTHKKIEKLPIKYNLPTNVRNPLEGENYVTLCCISKKPIKDMPLDTAVDLINIINKETGYKVALTGAGELSENYAQKLELAGVEFINLVNKTTLLELGAVLKGSAGLISVDTGTMHFANALGVPTVAVFYEKGTFPVWGPKSDWYDSVIIENNQTAENIFREIMKKVCV